jgi:uncharacterized protein YutE (UPF0331/DUF86 family)
MTDAERVRRKLGEIDRWVQELRSLAVPALVEQDVKERRFVERTLQVVVQACQDVASHIVSDDGLGEPRTNQELFELLAGSGWIDPTLAAALRRAVGFRNLLVHGYSVVEPRIVRDVLEHRLGDIEAFVAAIRARLERAE